MVKEDIMCGMVGGESSGESQGWCGRTEWEIINIEEGSMAGEEKRHGEARRMEGKVVREEEDNGHGREVNVRFGEMGGERREMG